MAFDTLITTDRGAVRVITINRPEKLNALTKTVLNELEQAFNEIEKQPDLRAVVITGAGEKAFVAGADIGEMKALTPPEAEMFSGRGNKLMDQISALRIPVIAAVNGFCLGGGLELALACDFIYASENAKLGLVEVNLGLIPGFGGNARLLRRVGAAQSAEMIYTAKLCKAQEALELGLVNKVTPVGEVVDEALKTANTIAEKGPYAVALAKALIRDSKDADQRTANRLEQHSFGLVFGTDDHQEGLEAFLEKRKATFEGR